MPGPVKPFFAPMLLCLWFSEAYLGSHVDMSAMMPVLLPVSPCSESGMPMFFKRYHASEDARPMLIPRRRRSPATAAGPRIQQKLTNAGRSSRCEQKAYSRMQQSFRFGANRKAREGSCKLNETTMSFVANAAEAHERSRSSRREQKLANAAEAHEYIRSSRREQKLANTV